MKKNRIARLVAVMLGTIMLTNCTVYNAVQQPPACIAKEKGIILYKDGLVFYIRPVVIRNDTLIARLTDQLMEPARKERVDLYLKPGLNLEQDSLGVLTIPFSYVDRVDNYVPDRKKTTRNILLAVGCTVAGGVIIFTALVVKALNEPWHMDPVKFRI